MYAAVFWTFLLVPTQEAKPKLDFPKSAIPIFGIAKAGQRGKLVTVSVRGGGEIRVASNPVQEPRVKWVRVEGKKEPVPTTVLVETGAVQKQLVYHGVRMVGPGTMKDPPEFDYPRTENVFYKIAESKFFDLQGKAVPPAEVTKRLCERRPILIVVDPKRIDPFYTAALNPQTLQFVPPAAEKNARRVPVPR